MTHGRRTEGNRVRYLNMEARQVATVAGADLAGYAGDGGPATSALLNSPRGLYMAATGGADIIVVDSGNHAVRRIRNGNITTIAGAAGCVRRTQGLKRWQVRTAWAGV